MAKLLQQCFCSMRQNRQCLVKLWKCQKAMSILPHEAKALLQLFSLQPIIFNWRQNCLVLLSPEAKEKFIILHWRTGLDRTDDFQKFCESGLDRIHFYRISTGLGLKNFTVRSLLISGLLDWVEFLTSVEIVHRVSIWTRCHFWCCNIRFDVFRNFFVVWCLRIEFYVENNFHIVSNSFLIFYHFSKIVCICKFTNRLNN